MNALDPKHTEFGLAPDAPAKTEWYTHPPLPAHWKEVRNKEGHITHLYDEPYINRNGELHFVRHFVNPYSGVVHGLPRPDHFPLFNPHSTHIYYASGKHFNPPKRPYSRTPEKSYYDKVNPTNPDYSEFGIDWNLRARRYRMFPPGSTVKSKKKI